MIKIFGSEKVFLIRRQVMKNTAIVTFSFLFLLGMSSYAQANHEYGESYGDDDTVYESHRTVTNYDDGYCPDETYSRSYSRHGYGRHQNRYQRSHHGYRSHQPTRIYVEKHVYNYGVPRATQRQTYRTYNQQPVYYPPTQSYSSYNNGYGGNVVGNTLIGGAFGAAAGAAIGAAVGNPGQGAALGAAIGGFGGLGRGIFGRGLLW